MGWKSVAVEPAAPADPAGRGRAADQFERVEHGVVERARDPHGPEQAPGPAEANVARGVDGEARVAAQQHREHIAEQPLRDSAAIELDSRRTCDGSGGT